MRAFVKVNNGKEYVRLSYKNNTIYLSKDLMKRSIKVRDDVFKTGW